MNLIDYRVYKLSLKEYFIFGLAGIIILITFSLLFYNSLIPAVFLTPSFVFYFKQLKVFLLKLRNERLCNQFKDAILSISASLETGYSIENSIWEAYLEISVIYSRNSYMSKELDAIYNQIKLSIPIEDAFSNFSKRTDIEDITTFCEILKIAKRTDGNLVAIISSTVKTISQKLDIKREINTNINGKKFEQLIMAIMPICIILYIKLSTPDFFNPIYHNIAGIIFVSICLLVYAFAIFISTKITRFEV